VPEVGFGFFRLAIADDYDRFCPLVKQKKTAAGMLGSFFA
jgi:hypothetical protein